jgi:4-amino-4-deoxy-L-arabinose transferase-like glycosyltransferase
VAAGWPAAMVPGSAAQADAAAIPDGQSARPGRPGSLPLTLPVILAAQIILSARLVTANTAFQDEALYLWAGRLEVAHWLTGTPIPPYPSYFSGAPVIYPPLAALAASVGGLPAARCLSLLFMLAATVMLHGVTRRIFDRRAALFAAALFAGTGSAQFLGAFATYDAMALSLLAAGVWLGARAVDAARLRPAALAVAGAAIALANATKYAAALYDPVVLAVIILFAWDRHGRPAALYAAAVVSGTAVALLAAAAGLAGPAYWHGVTSTTLTRAIGPSPALGILLDGFGWVVAILIFALAGAPAVAYVGRDWPMKASAVVMLGALFLAPVEQARIHTCTSLFKHVGYGAWFGSAVAGFAIAGLAHAVPASKAPRAFRLGIAAVAAAAVLGAALAGNQYGNWPRSATYTARLRPALTATAGQPQLIEDDSVPAYYLPGQIGWRQLVNTVYFVYTDPATGRKLRNEPAYASAIEHRYFALISLALNLPADRAIQRDISASGEYRLAAIIPYRTTSFRGSYRIWLRKPRWP